MNKGQKGKFITVEGQDGAGKTTNIDYIRDQLKQNGIEVLLTREPGGTKLGEELRNLMLNGDDLPINDMAELLMMFAARAQHISEVIRPAISAGTWVLCDRFTDATFAYQSGGRGLPPHYVETLQRLVQGDLQPDLTILLDVDLSTGQARSQQRNAGRDRFESEQMAFKQRVRDAYLDLAHKHPNRICVIDASLGLSEVQKQILHVLNRFLEGSL